MERVLVIGHDAQRSSGRRGWNRYRCFALKLGAVPGILILAGMGVQIPPGGLVFTEADDGGAVGEVKEVRVRLDLWPTWLEIAAERPTKRSPRAHSSRRNLTTVGSRLC